MIATNREIDMPLLEARSNSDSPHLGNDIFPSSILDMRIALQLFFLVGPSPSVAQIPCVHTPPHSQLQLFFCFFVFLCSIPTTCSYDAFCGIGRHPVRGVGVWTTSRYGEKEATLECELNDEE
jgi:hypothetical protein